MKGYQSFTSMKRWVSTAAFILGFFLLLFSLNSFIKWNGIQWPSNSKTVQLIYSSKIVIRTTLFKSITNSNPKTSPKQTHQYPLNCFNGNSTSTCPTHYPATFDWDISSNTSCPDYFRWIHEDLKPWKNNGITREVMERAKNIADFRLVILNGKAYVEQHRKSFQTRDVFTLWGILQLLRLYPGKVPDLELLFGCGDVTVVDKRGFGRPEGLAPPPMFHYCGHEDAFDIVFPDWTFWGWIETNIRPWETLLQSIEEGNKKTKWKKRIPYAFWKGNQHTSSVRRELMKCNSSNSAEYDWNARLYSLDWGQEIKQGFENTKLENQCTHKYKIYVEGVSWSVSEKYILACDSMTLIVKPNYYDFFTRSLEPLQHYWPIRSQNLCKDIKFAVEWGNTQTNKAQAIGKGGTSFLHENLKMKFVYDYMFHLLQEYAKLLRLKPITPKGAIEICSETMACPMDGLGKKFMVESMVMSPSYTPPCTMPPPFGPENLQGFLKKKESLIKGVEKRSDEFWHSLN